MAGYRFPRPPGPEPESGRSVPKHNWGEWYRAEAAGEVDSRFVVVRDWERPAVAEGPPDPAGFDQAGPAGPKPECRPPGAIPAHRSVSGLRAYLLHFTRI